MLRFNNRNDLIHYTEDHPTCRGGAPFDSDGRVAGDHGRAEATRTGVPEGGGGRGRGRGKGEGEDTTVGRNQKMTSHGNENQKMTSHGNDA